MQLLFMFVSLSKSVCAWGGGRNTLLYGKDNISNYTTTGAKRRRQREEEKTNNRSANERSKNGRQKQRDKLRQNVLRIIEESVNQIHTLFVSNRALTPLKSVIAMYEAPKKLHLNTLLL